MNQLVQFIPLSPYWISVLTTGCILAIASVGLQITLSSGQFSIFHAALMGLGAYAGGYLSVTFAVPLAPSLVISCLVGGAAGGVVAVLLSRLSGWFFGIATLALGEATVIIVQTFFPGQAEGFTGVPIDVNLPLPAILLVAILVAMKLLKASRAMIGVLAVGSDPIAATSLGISVRRVKFWCFAGGGALAGLAGGLNVHYLGLTVPSDLAYGAETQLLIYVILGGIETPVGAAVGALSIAVCLGALRVATLDRFWIEGLLFVVVVLVRPRGLLVRWPLGWGWSVRPGWWRRLRAVESETLEPVLAPSGLEGTEGASESALHAVKRQAETRG